MRANVSWASDEYNLNPDKHSVNKRGGKKASHEIREDVSRFFCVFFLIDGTNKLVLSVISHKVES